jgi:hypothetical protein
MIVTEFGEGNPDFDNFNARSFQVRVILMGNVVILTIQSM